MQDRQNARLMNMRPTGNGRRQSYAHVPMPRMTNTYMLAGDRDPGEILASVKDGNAAINDKTRPLLEIIAKYTNLPVEQVIGNCAYIDASGKLDVKNVDNQIKWLQEQGFVDKGFGADAIIDKDFVKAG